MGPMPLVLGAGEASRVALPRLLSRGQVTIVRLGTDPYGRTLATVSVNGVDAGDYLVAQGLARPWRLAPRSNAGRPARLQTSAFVPDR